MFDADGEYSDAVTYTLTNGGNGKYALTVTADAEWINDEGRAFPVTVDPPINSTPDKTNMVDTYIDSDNPSSSYSTFSYLASGTGSKGQEFISYWKLSELPTIPATSFVVSAQFSLYCQNLRPHSDNATHLKLGVYQVTSAWTAQNTWTKHTSNNVGAFAEKNLIDYADLTSSSKNNYITWDITRLYRMWQNGTSNQGVAIVQLDNNNVDALLSSSESSNIPRLILNYRDMKGIESYWSGSSHSAGLAGSGYVNHANGNLVFAIDTIATGDSLFGFVPQLVYNSSLAHQYNTQSYNKNVPYRYMSAGYSMKLNTNETIVEKTFLDEIGDNVTYCIWADGDGTEHYFLPDSDSTQANVFKDEDGLLMTLTMDDSGYSITDVDGNIRHFKKYAESTTIYAGGVLDYIQDAHGNKLLFALNDYGQTTKISVLPSGHTSTIEYLTLTYNSMHALSEVRNNFTQQVVSFLYYMSYTDTTYTGNYYGGPLYQVKYGHLSGTTLVYDATTTYTYTAAIGPTYSNVYRLATATDDSAGTSIRYAYDTSGRVANVTEYGGSSKGQSIGFTYGTGYTQVRNSGKDDILQAGTNSDDIITRYSLDYQGRAVGAYSTNTDGTAMYGATNGAYNTSEDNGEAKNSLKSSAVMNGVAVNYLRNGGFTYGSAGWYGISGNISVNTSYSNNENKRLSITVAASEEKMVYQYVSVPNGEYTLSALFNVAAKDKAVVKLRAESMDYGDHTYETQYSIWADQSDQTFHSPTLTFTADGGNTGYENYKVIIEVVGDSAEGATVYLDNVMLENNIGAGAFNMIQYGGFDKTSITYTGGTDDHISDYWMTDQATNAFYETKGMGGSTALRIDGDINEYQYVYQTIPMTSPGITGISAPARTFTVSGFAKGSHQVANEWAYFSLEIEILYSDGVYEYLFYDFNKELADWQFVSGTFTTKSGKLVKSITVCCAYAHQPGTAYFDGISLIEETGNNSVRYNYNEDGLMEFKYTPSSSEYYEYDENNNMTAVYNSEGNGCAYVYDGNDTLLSQTSFRYNVSDHDLLTWYFSERASNEKWSITTKAISKTEYSINQYGLNTQTISYAAYGNKDSATQAGGTKRLVSASTYELTASSYLFGKVLTTTDTSGYTTTYKYDSTGKLKYEVNNDHSGLYYIYDTLGRLKNVYPLAYAVGESSYNSLAENVTYAYNTDHSLNTITTDSTVYSFSYDEFGNTTAIMIGEGDDAVALATYQYAANNGKLLSMTYGNGKIMTYTYDELDRVKEICYTDSSNNNQYYRYTYTATGSVYTVECTETGRIYRYNYNTKDQLIGSTELVLSGTDADGNPVYTDLLQSAYWYDDQDRIDITQNIIPYALSSGNRYAIVQYGYTYDDSEGITNDTVGALDKFEIWGGDDTEVDYNFYYDKLYRLSAKLMSTNGEFYQDFSYVYRDQNSSTTTGQFGNVTSSVGTNTGYIDTDYSYEYDNLGNITKIIETTSRYEFDDNGNVTETVEGEKVTQYKYDDMGQLIREDNPYLGKSYTYTYDNAGNRTYKKTYAYTTGTLGTATTIENYIYGADAWKDQLTQIKKNDTVISTFSFDAIGNPATFNGYSLTWNGRTLMEMSMNGGQFKYSFTYNDEGIRTAKYSNGTWHYYALNGTQVVSETWGSRMLVYLYDESGAPIGLQYRQNSYAAGEFDTYYFEKNIFGDIIAIYTEDGVKIGSYTYDAWGNCTATVVPGNTTLESAIVRNYNPFRYRGYFYDTETQLYYLQSRYYNPAWGRFLNSDKSEVITATPMSLTDKNLYAYCDNNPITRKDEDGDFWNVLIGAGIGALINVGVNYITAKMDGQDYTWKNLVVDAACGAITGAAAASGIPVAGQAIVGAVVGFGGSVASDVLNGETEIDVTKAINYAASGALGGLMGGNGIRFGNSMQFGNILTGKLTSEIVPAVIKTGLVFAGASFAGSFLNHSYDNMNGQRGRIYFDLEEGRFTW
jgi:RHS repeat-associated protein